ncbi:MAG: hypothetical protein P4K93_11680 [Terracidiphilus sp.]|nr:hypothetical protein [Terracidiphilus sp.]
MAISTVYAYRDDGFMSPLTKWKPRRVECTRTPDHQGRSGEMFVVKYARGNEGCACAISELVCTQMLSKLGILTLNPFIINVSPGFAASCNFKSDFPYKISPGDHFGTLLETNVENGPPIALIDLMRPFDIVLLWVADTWIGNIDREREGNTLLRLVGTGKYDVIASDQSDCFCGTSRFCSGDFRSTFSKKGSASAPAMLPAAIASAGGRTALTNAISRVQQLLNEIPGILSTVPEPWWHESAIQPADVARALRARSDQLAGIIRPEIWEVPDGCLI